MHLHNYFQTIDWALLQTFYCNNWIGKGQWENANMGRFHLSMYKNVSQEKFVFFDNKNFQICRNFTIWNPNFTVPLRILLKPWTLSFTKDTVLAKAVSQLISLDERKKLRFTLKMKNLVFQFIVRTWDKFLVAMFAMKLEWCCKEKDLTNQNLPVLSVNTLSWYTRTWLSTISLTTQKFHCCCRLKILPSNFGYHTFVEVSRNLGGKIPVLDDVLSSHEREIHSITSLNENCIEFKFQTDWNYYVDLRQTYLALKLKFVKGRGYEIYSTKEV